MTDPRTGKALVHVRRTLRDYPTPTPQPTPCRLWQGTTTAKGYGRRVDNQLVHRWVWIQVHGEPPAETPLVLHHCDQPLCYRLDHLWLGTIADNQADMKAKGRARGGSTQQISDDIVRGIRSQRGARRSARSVAREYGVHHSTVTHRWKQMEDE